MPPSLRPRVLWASVLLSLLLFGRCLSADTLPPATSGLLRRFCADCHGPDLAEAQLNLEQLADTPNFGRAFRDWKRVTRMLREGKMPPADSEQPTAAARAEIIGAIEQGLASYIERHAGDPGPVVIRRLTSAEYAYTCQDLTGLDLNLERTFVSDAAGGEGFTNVGGAQYMQDSTLERYLESAHRVAGHAVIGAGPLFFFRDAGRTGRELSAITRIQDIYRQHGFRTAAGEGAEPFGLDLYPRAFLVAWRYRHRAALPQPGVSLAELAREEALSVRFCEHIDRVLELPDPPFPLSEIVSRWQALPPPAAFPPPVPPGPAIRTACEEIAESLREWQRTLAASAGDEEEASVLTAGEIDVSPRHSFVADINWEDGLPQAQFEVSVATASKQSSAGAYVVWREPRLRFRREDRRRDEPVPLRTVLAPESLERLAFGRHPAGGRLGENDFVLTGEASVPLILQIPPGKVAGQFTVEVELDSEYGDDRIVRCRISDGQVAGETAAEVGETSTLLANPRSADVAAWQAGVAEFARLMPEVSHREPAPSDRDPIPAPFDNTYNKPERNHFHYAIKYHRDDAFLVAHILDDTTRRQLDQAWTDLLTSFEYHDANLRFAVKKFGLDERIDSIAELTPQVLADLPAEPRRFLQQWWNEWQTMRDTLQAAEPGHVEDVLRWTAAAWRRPLRATEQAGLRDFYRTLRRDEALDHPQAIRGMLARVLVAPSFLYRVEPPRGPGAQASESAEPSPSVPLNDWELASRLSYLLWSSLPDEDLRRAAAAGELRDPQQLERQTRRMLRDPKARRFATEFFGQWLGFYRFDQYRGVDPERFPEFTESLRASLHEEAVAFFEYIVREDRPAEEILFADYTFLNDELARHYQIETESAGSARLARVAGVDRQHRGGLLGLGAVLATTSAPLRTSAVKRGDWLLRRVLGTPVPPPPANAGSIAADDVSADGLTVRARLEKHRREASCANCHSRIDPLGFALEHFDPLGRWRDTYRDGQPIDSSGTLHDGTEIRGLDGLRQYLRREQPRFQETLSVKLLGYALGRSELASDRPLLDEMTAAAAREQRFSALVVTLVQSRQFRDTRPREN